MEDNIADVPKEQKDAWKRVTNLIYNAGFCDGRREGYEAGKETVTFGKRAMFQSSFFILGTIVGGVFGTIVATIVMVKLSGG